MTQMLDDAFRYGFVMPFFMAGNDVEEFKRQMEPLMKPILSAVCIDVTDVCEYLYAIHGKEYWTMDDWPNLAPPFEFYWMEMHRPSKTNSEGLILTTEKWSKRWGFIFRTTRTNSGWRCWADMFTQNEPKDRVTGPVCEWEYDLDENGKLVKEPEYWSVFNDEFKYMADDMLKMFNHQIWPCFLATSLMRCKNVELSEKEIGEKFRKIYEKRHKVALLKFYTLNIKGIGSNSSQSTKSENRLPWHLRRGHFRHYGGEHGLLFGRYEGTFWIPATVVGDREKGVNIKDYKVEV